MNPLRIRILSEIDEHGSCTVTLDELAEAFRHDKHWRNWAAKWNLDLTVDPTYPRISFHRKLRGF